MKCPLCDAKTQPFSKAHQRVYHRCNTCSSIVLAENHRLSVEQEKQRYLLHQNDVNDTGYQKFVSPIVQNVLKKQKPSHQGLDFGSGSGPVIAKMLTDKNYTITTYDPIFDPNKEALNQTYDYIICCEVMEHFYNPAKEFKLLYSILKHDGTLYCKTNLFSSDINFDSWWYKNDPTHVFFYTEATLLWISNRYNFKEVFIQKDLIIFRK